MGKYGMFRSSRFLIDKIDAKLGDVDKEIKFDKSAISACIILFFVGLGLVALGSSRNLSVGLIIIGVLLSLFCFFAYAIMKQELEDDKKKAEKMKAKAPETEQSNNGE